MSSLPPTQAAKSPPERLEKPLRPLLGALGLWFAASPGVWIGTVALASLWPLMEQARSMGLIPPTPSEDEFGQLAWIGSLAGTVAGLVWLSRHETSAWLFSSAARWRSEAAVLLLTTTSGVLAGGLLPWLELGGPAGQVLTLVLLHTFLGLTLRRALHCAPHAAVWFLALAWILPALAPAGIRSAIAHTTGGSGALQAVHLGACALSASGWMLLSLREPGAPPRLSTTSNP